MKLQALLELLRALQGHLACQQAVPELAAEVTHRVIELLKVCETLQCSVVLQTCCWMWALCC